MIPIGTQAPRIDTVDQDGNPVRLSDYQGRPVVLFFFPKVGTKICTAEACAFQQELPDFDKLGAAVIGISRDSAKDQKEFSERYGLEYPLISDHGGGLAAAYKIPSMLGIVASRTTVVIDSAGIVRATFRNELNGAAHVEAARLAIQALEIQPATQS